VIAGYEGGTGASPVSSLKHAGLPWELGIAETQQVLVQNGLRDRIRLQLDGGLRTARDVVIGALLGAEEFGMATASLVATGCVMLRKCHLNTCSVGIATQDPELRARFAGRPEDVVEFFTMIAEGVRALMARLGVRKFDDLVGRVELLTPRAGAPNGPDVHWKAKKLDLRCIVAAPDAPASAPRRFLRARPWPLEDHIDHQILAKLGDSLTAAGNVKQVKLNLPIENVHRAAGTLLSGEIARHHGAHGLPDDTIHVRFHGSAGQSFGAFLAQGVTLELSGEANDYIGKGLSGAITATRPASPASGSRSATAARARSSRAWATTAAST